MMTGTKTSREVQIALEAVKKEIDMLQNKHMRLKLLQEMQDRGVTKAYALGFTAGNALPAKPN